MATHNKFLFLIIPIFSLIISGCVTTPEVKPDKSPKPPCDIGTRTWEKVNEEQPISIGEVIYTTGQLRRVCDDWDCRIIGVLYTITVSYRYMGVDDKNNIKVIYKFEFAARDYFRNYLESEGTHIPQVETFPLLLPLNAKKQTILEVKSFKDSPYPGLKKELLITVIDEFGRITVEEVEKTPTK